MEEYMEDKLADIKQEIIEVKSSLQILQQAVQNEYNSADNTNIDNLLEILISRLSHSISELENIGQ